MFQIHRLNYSPLLLFGLCLALGGSSFAHADIVGGDDVNPQDPIAHTTVALYRKTAAGGMLCSATLIAPRVAVTAAHCVEKGTDDMVVIFGEDIRSGDRGVVRVGSAEIAPERRERHFDDQDLGDIAVVHLEGQFPKGFHKAPLLPKSVELKKGDSVILAGFGISDAIKKNGEGKLRRATVQVVRPEFGKTEILFDQKGGSGACYGDSGGPAFLERNGKYYLLGVTSRGYPENAPDDCKHEVIYTRIDAYRDWISQQARSNSNR